MKKEEKQEIKDAVEKCKTELKDTKKEVRTDRNIIEELTCLLQRVQADFENYKKHVEKVKKDAAFFNKKDLVTSLLPVLDMFELALKYTDNHEEFVKGVKMIYAQFLATLENEGLTIISQNRTFDPELHEAVMIEDSHENEGTILEELQKGYMLSNKVIRFSRVKIAKKHDKVH